MDIRLLTVPEVGAAVEWAAAEGWNPGLNDAAAFFAADPGGFLGVDQRGSLAGTISAVRYGASYGFIGLFLVPKAFRGDLLGLRLGRAALERLDGVCVGTDGVAAKERQYVRLAGFRRVWQNIRFRGQVDGVARAQVGDLRAGGGAAPPADASLCRADQVPFAELAAYDARHFGARRDAFLREWLTLPGHRAWVCRDQDVGGASAGLRGLGVVRACLEGWKIGPLFADDAGVAEALFRQLVGAVAGPVTLDVPSANPAAIALARRYSMEPVFRTARIYRNGDPGLPVAHIFGITTFELG
jgi:hypothetical protein